MNVFRYPERTGLIDAQDALLDKRALAVTMAVMTRSMSAGSATRSPCGNTRRLRVPPRPAPHRGADARLRRRALDERADPDPRGDEHPDRRGEVRPRPCGRPERPRQRVRLPRPRSFPAGDHRWPGPSRPDADVRTSWLGIGAVLADAPPIPQVPPNPQVSRPPRRPALGLRREAGFPRLRKRVGDGPPGPHAHGGAPRHPERVGVGGCSGRQASGRRRGPRYNVRVAPRGAGPPRGGGFPLPPPAPA